MKEILIADSDKADHKEFQRIFGATEYHLVFLESGEDALLRVKLFKPDLIIAGTALTEKNGYELCEAIKEDPDSRSIPFILLLNMFEDLSEKDRKRLKPDGILSKPLHESQVLDMVDGFLKGMRPKGADKSKGEMVLETFGDMGRERFATDTTGTEEEIIDLLDVVEEPEAKMSIDDFVVSEKGEAFEKIASLESWEKLTEEEKVATEDGFILSLEGEQEEVKDLSLAARKEEPSLGGEPQGEDLFEKIELEDILDKVGKIDLGSVLEEPSAIGAKVSQKVTAPIREVEEKPFVLDEFEKALKEGVKAERSTREGPAMEVPIEAKAVATEGFPKDLFGDMLGEVELKEKRLQEEVLEAEGQKEELQEEELKEEKLFEEEELLEEEGVFEEEFLEAQEPLTEESLETVEKPRKEERIDLLEELEALKVSGEEKAVVRAAAKMESPRREIVEARPGIEKEIAPAFRTIDRQLEEAISEKMRVTVQEFMTKHVPEMTKEIVKLTIERIGKLVEEIVPDLAEKMIEDEIKRLEKGETE